MVRNISLADLKSVSTKELARIWSIAVAVFIVTLAGCLLLELNYFDGSNLKSLAPFHLCHGLIDRN